MDIDDKMNMDEDKLKPSVFTKHPWNSILCNTESEIVARNIMVILARLGDTWQKLTWRKYKSECKKDSGFSKMEKHTFEKVYPMVCNPIGAIGFSPCWKEAAEKVVA